MKRLAVILAAAALILAAGAVAWAGPLNLNLLVDDTAAKAGTYGAGSMRPIVLSNDGTKLYAGYLWWGYDDANPDTMGVYEYDAGSGVRTRQNTDRYYDHQFANKGLAIDSAGNIYSNDPDRDRIIVIKPDLTTSVPIDLDVVIDGDPGNDGAKEYDPEGLVVHGNRLFFSTDAANLGRVYALGISQFTGGFDTTDTMTLDTTWGGGDGYAQMETKNNYGKMAIDSSGNIYVPNEDNQVWKIDSAGNDVGLPLVSAPGCDGLSPVDVAFFDGSIYVAYNADDGSVPDGSGIGVYEAATGNFIDYLTDPKLNAAEGVAVSSDGLLYVSQGYFGQQGYTDVVFKSSALVPEPETAIPEPAAAVVWLLGAGVVLCCAAMRGRRRKL